MIRKTLDLLHPEGTIEIRAFPKKNQAFSGYFRDREKLLKEIKKYSHLTWYVVMNKIDEACYSRSQCERIEGPYVTTTTGDGDIKRLKWLLIDVDPERTSGVSATDDEKASALDLIVQIQDYLTDVGFPNPVFCDSGNGFHLLYKIDLPHKESKTIELFLKVLDSIFSNERAKVDTAVFNPSRITKLYGTVAIKGSNTQERPHRESSILNVPKPLEIVPVELIRKVSDLFANVAPETKPETPRSYCNGFDIDSFLSEHQIQIQSDSYIPEYRARKIVLSECVFDSSHKAPDACILQFDSGALTYKCLHDSCRQYGWKDFRLKYDPYAYDNRDTRKSVGKASIGRYDRIQTDTKPLSSQKLLSCFKTLDTFEEEEAEWLVDSLIPKAQITTIASDGGIGKTTLWCTLIAAISAGRSCFLDPPGYQRDPQLVAFLTSEDSVRKKLHKKLREAGANMENIITPDFADDKEGIQRKLKFGSSEMEAFIRHFKPAVCIFDPIQGFVPPEINMGSRNAMRDCMAPLVGLGEETGTTFCVICHTNKRKGAYGRDRVADSADLWDISRSVLMMGYTEEQGVRYLSHEKSNYGNLQETRLFTIDETGKIIPAGTTWKRDREYQNSAISSTSPATRQECEKWIIQRLEASGGMMPVKELENDASNDGYNSRTLRRAKEELKKNGEIGYQQLGIGKEKAWFIKQILLPNEWNT